MKLATAIATLALAAGVAPNAFAQAGSFGVDPTALSGVTAGSPFTADFIEGASSAYATLSGDTQTVTTWIQFTGFENGGTNILPGTTGLGISGGYGLYATLSETASCNQSVFSIGLACALTSISVNIYADPGNDAVFTAASLSGPPTVANTGGDILLGSATTALASVLGINSLGGAYSNVTTNLTLTAAGSAYLDSPVPFYDMAFSEFNNTSTGVSISASGSVLAVNGESGGVQFNMPIPEPGGVSLVGLGLVALGALRGFRRA